MPGPAPPGARLTTKAKQQQPDESIYACAGILLPPAAPKEVKYNVPSTTSPTGNAGRPHRAPMHADSSQVQHLLNPIQGPRDAQVRMGIKPMDHARSNAQAVREASQLNALRKAAAEAQERNQGASPSYHTVRTPSAGARRPVGQGTSPIVGRNFLEENKLGAGVPVKPARVAKQEEQFLHKQDYGRVPTYLLERKIELAQHAEEQERQREAALIPPGMRLLPEEERLETLAILAKNKVDVERALQGLPLRIETPSAIRRKEDLERRLAEIEDATKIFSRPKVLVHS